MDNVERIERRLSLRDVRVLMAAVQTGSMHRAAERLHTSQPAVSRSIADLEQVLGVRLLDRSRQGVEPTHFGRAIIKRSIAALDELRQGIRDIEFLANPTAGELRIGCTEQVAAGPGLAVFERLAQRHPRMVFNVMTGGTPTLQRNLIERNVELVMAGIGGRFPEEFAVEKLFDDSLVVAAGSESPWARRRKIELGELANERWIFPPFDSDAGVATMEAFRASGLKVPPASVVTASLNLRYRLLATGRYLSMLAGYAFISSGRRSLLRALPVELPKVRRSVVIVTVRNRTLSPVAELFIETARAVAKPLAKAK